MKNIEIIPIAENKLKRRKIPKEWLRETLADPEEIAAGYGGRKVAQKRYEIENRKYLLRVVFEDKGDYYLIVTAYLTSQVDRYWKGGK